MWYVFLKWIDDRQKKVIQKVLYPFCVFAYNTLQVPIRISYRKLFLMFVCQTKTRIE